MGALFRSVRQRLGWRQVDVGRRAGVSRTTVSRIERHHLDSVTPRTLLRVGRVLEIRIDMVGRWRGGEADRLLNAGHAAMHEQLAALFERLPGWVFAPEVSFSIFGERGVIDILAWHEATRTLLVIELKTELVDISELLGTLHRKQRNATTVAAERGWKPDRVATWLVVRDTRTNRRRLAEHRRTLRAALPTDGRTVPAWLRCPAGPLAALSFLPDDRPRSVGRAPTGVRRVRRSSAAPN